MITDAGGPAWDAAGFARLVEAARTALAPARRGRGRAGGPGPRPQAHEAEAALGRGPRLRRWPPAYADLRRQLAGLIYPGFVAETGARRLPDLVRYLTAMNRRLDKMPESPARDAERMAGVHRVTDAWQQALAALSAPRRAGADVQAVRWMIEELRVSLFAQQLGTTGPVSEQRIQRALDRLTGR